MSAGNNCETDQLKLIYQAVPWANVGDNAASSPSANITVALHTSDPGEGGTQSTNEASYTGYARVSVPRTAVRWAVANGIVTPVLNIEFPRCTAGAAQLATHFSTGTGVSNYLLHSGAITPNISIGVGTVPKLTPASQIILD